MSDAPSSPVRVAVIVSRIRVEEKLLLTALEVAGAQVQVVNDDELVLPVANLSPSSPSLAGMGARGLGQADVVLERSVSAARGIYAVRMLEALGYPTVNR